MTTLYRPVLIESVEQVEALPDGAILHRVRGASGLTGMVIRSPHTGQTYFRVGVDHWPVSRVVNTFTEALVPVEAEEEPTDAEVEAAAEGLCDRYGRPGMWEHAPDHLRRSFRGDARAALSAARRDKEKR